jgi:hypothetical protein
MAKQIRVTLDDNHVPNVLDVEFGLDVGKDTNGAPVDARPRLKTIKISRRSDESTDLWSWALKPHMEYFKSGKIEFLDPRHEDKVLKTVEFKDSFLKAWREVVPNVNERRNDPQIEYVEISASTITINGVEWTGSGTWI